jgi:hypothetical protein
LAAGTGVDAPWPMRLRTFSIPRPGCGHPPALAAPGPAPVPSDAGQRGNPGGSRRRCRPAPGPGGCPAGPAAPSSAAPRRPSTLPWLSSADSSATSSISSGPTP